MKESRVMKIARGIIRVHVYVSMRVKKSHENKGVTCKKKKKTSIVKNECDLN